MSAEEPLQCSAVSGWFQGTPGSGRRPLTPIAAVSGVLVVALAEEGRNAQSHRADPRHQASSLRIVCEKKSGAGDRSVAMAERYRFEECAATNAAGSKCTIPAGTHAVSRNSLAVRVQVGGRVIELTLAEFARMQAEAKVSEA